MPVSISCKVCGKVIAIAPGSAGRTVRCGACGNVLTFTGPAAGAIKAAPNRPRSQSPHEEIISHMARVFGPVKELGLNEILPASGVRINVIPARSAAHPLILFTTGMSDVPQNVPQGHEAFRFTELLIRLPADWPLNDLSKPNNYWPVQWLRQIAGYPRAHSTWLGGPVTIISNNEPPRPLASNTQLSCMMIARESGGLSPILCKDGRRIVLYSLFPLYREERDLEKSGGIAALFEQFEAHDIPFVVDVRRTNVAQAVHPRPLAATAPRSVGDSVPEFSPFDRAPDPADLLELEPPPMNVGAPAVPYRPPSYPKPKNRKWQLPSRVSFWILPVDFPTNGGRAQRLIEASLERLGALVA